MALQESDIDEVHELLAGYNSLRPVARIIMEYFVSLDLNFSFFLRQFEKISRSPPFPDFALQLAGTSAFVCTILCAIGSSDRILWRSKTAWATVSLGWSEEDYEFWKKTGESARTDFYFNLRLVEPFENFTTLPCETQISWSGLTSTWVFTLSCESNRYLPYILAKILAVRKSHEPMAE